MTEQDEYFMRKAIKLARKGMNKNAGGPFGAIVVKDGKIISKGYNKVTSKNDPTAHAEVVAIRKACKKLGTFQLDDCTIYTSCEPCPMCLGAIYWAHIDKVFYGNNKADARNIGFDDSFIYDELDIPINKRKIEFVQLLPDEAIKAFKSWNDMDDKVKY